jgi:hypothetical protein
VPHFLALQIVVQIGNTKTSESWEFFIRLMGSVFQPLITFIKFINRPTVHFGCMGLILLLSGHCHVAATCGRCQGGETGKHIDIIKICLITPQPKIIKFLVKFTAELIKL